MWKWLFSLPVLLSAQAQLEPQSMLHQADWIAKKYSFEVAKTAPPPLFPQPERCLTVASSWFSIDLEDIATPAFSVLNNESLWDILREIGIEGVYLKGLKQGGSCRTGMGLDPKWGPDWNDVALLLQKKGMTLIGDAMGNCTGLCPDFALALKNVGDYPGLYHLVEIEKRDWKLLPPIAASQPPLNVPWLTLQQLHKKGYVPEDFAPYVKESSWNATAPIQCADGKVRRWIYLKEKEGDPVIDWLNPSFAGARIATADLLDSIYRLGGKGMRLDGSISANAKETLSLWIRKLGGFSVLEENQGLDSMKSASVDLIADTVTRPALLHALLAEDAEALKVMYRLFLEEGIETKRLVHALQPFDAFSCDWAELLLHPKRKYTYYDEVLTGEALRHRLLKEDLLRLGNNPMNTWPGLCTTALRLKDLEKQREDVTELHLLLAFFYAMQPGVFSFSVSDLVGAVDKQKLNLMGSNETTLYASLPGQINNGKSFASQLRKILAIRRDTGIANGELIAIPRTQHPGLMLLVHQQKGMLQLLAVNFGRTKAEQSLEMPLFRHTTAIDLMTGLAEKKPLDASTISLSLPPLTGKVILFQPKYLN